MYSKGKLSLASNGEQLEGPCLGLLMFSYVNPSLVSTNDPALPVKLEEIIQ